MTNSNHSPVDVSPQVINIGKLLDRMVKGRLRIPKFQRPFVWPPDQMCDLLDSIQQRFPIGSILIWETDDPSVSSRDEIGPISITSPPKGAVSYILDGQQRLATLLGVLRLPEGANVHWKWKIFYDLEEGIFFHPRNRDVKPYQIPARTFLITSDFIAECRRIVDYFEKKDNAVRAKELIEKAERVTDIFRYYQLPVISITDADIGAAVKIFARLNTHGRPIAPDQMASALTYRENGFHLDSEINHILEALTDHGFGRINRVAILRAVLAAAERDIYDTDWTRVVAGDQPTIDLVEAVRICKRTLFNAVEFLQKEGVISDRLLPYALQIVLLSEFFRLCPEPSSEVREELGRWFWVTSFTGWFATFNSSQAKLAIEEMRELAQGKRQRIESVKDEPALPFPDRFDGRSARVRAFLLYLVSLEPLALEKPEKLSTGDLLPQLGSRALRYIVSRGLSKELHSSPANRIFLNPAHRGQARKALAEIPKASLSEVCTSHGIPVEAIGLLQEGKLDDFIKTRLRCLLEGEREFMEKRRVQLPVNSEPGEIQIDTEGDEE